MSLLEGRYRVGRELARGGMGRVFTAVDERLRRPVAIKTLHEGAGQALQLRFVEEAQITGQLRHPNVIPVHELSCAGDELFLAMQLIEGRELKQLIQELAADEGGRARRAYPLNHRLRLFLQVCEAMAFAHDRGVIHRDLKPQNVMLGAADEVLVMDWGVAKPVQAPGTPRAESVHSLLRDGDDEDDASSQVTHRGAVIGTPAYMPLEQAEGSADLDARADVYALGAILYELLTFRPPFLGSAAKVLRALFKGPPPTPRERAPELEIPPAVEAIVLRAMAREREARYPTAAALAADVRAYLDDRAIGAYEEGLRETLARAWRRHRGALASAGVAALLIALAWGGALFAGRAAAQEARARQATAEEARREAEAQAAEAARSMAAQRANARGSELMRQASEAQAEFARRSAEVLTVAELEAAFADARRALAALRAGLAELEEADSLDDLTPFRASLDDAARRVARRCVAVFLARAPGALASLAAREGLELTVEDRARILLRQGARREAARLLADASETPAQAALASVARDEGPAARISALEAAMAAHPEAAWPYLYRAEARVAAGQVEEAEQDYLRAQLLEPLDAWVLYSKLRWVTPPYSNHVLVRNPLRVVAGDPARVGGAQTQAGGLSRELAPRMSAVTALKRAASRWRAGWDGTDEQGQRVGLVAEWSAARERGELPAEEAWQFLAEGALLYGAPEQARDFAQEGLAAFPDDRQLAGLLADALLAVGDLEQADAVAARGLAAHPWDPRLNYVRGEVLHRQGHPAEAAPHLRLGVNGWLLSDRWERLAACLSELDDPAAWEEGVRAAREALARDPFLENHLHPEWRPIGENPQPHRTLAELRIKQGKPMLGALHLTRAWVLSRLQPVVEKVGATQRDAKALAELHESLGLLPAASLYWRQAQRDPEFAAEAATHLAAIEAKLR